IEISANGVEGFFKPCSQIDSGLSRQYQGTGLGLAMIKLLAELHGGTLAVESAGAKGSPLNGWLPLRAKDEVERASEVLIAAPQVVQPGDRVALVVEDDCKSAELIRVPLETGGFKVLHAETAEGAS